MREKWYDEEIAPKLKEISKQCEEKGNGKQVNI